MAPQTSFDDPHAEAKKVGGQNKVVENPADSYIKNPPNNLGLDDPRTQDRASDLIGSQSTAPIDDTPQTEEEKKRVQALADKLNA